MADYIAGVICKTKFCLPGSDAFNGYIDYINRDNASRAYNSDKYNLYLNYMGNPMKTSNLFTSEKDQLSQEENLRVKELFELAQENQSIMWQTVFSFDNRWLKETGAMDENNNLNEATIMEATRAAMSKMLREEGLDKTALWTASIHYNTDNIHIHIASVEPEPVRETKMYNGEEQGKGTWKQKTLKGGKSAIANNIMAQTPENQIINDIIRKSFRENMTERTIMEDKELQELFVEIYNMLPDNKRMWQYGMTGLGNDVRSNLDRFTEKFLNKYHKEDMEKLDAALGKQTELYESVYGKSKTSQSYKDNKIKEMHKRLGNTILKEMKEYDKKVKGSKTKGTKPGIKNNHTAGGSGSKQMGKSSSQGKENEYHKPGGQKLANALKSIERSFRKDADNYRNQNIFEQLQREAEMEQGKF